MYLLAGIRSAARFGNELLLQQPGTGVPANYAGWRYQQFLVR